MAWTRIIYWIPAIIASIALITGGAGNFYCQSIKFTGASIVVDSTSGSSVQAPDVYFGPWYQASVTVRNIKIGSSNQTYVKYTHTCIPYQAGIRRDAIWNTVRTFSIFTTFIGSFYTLLLFLAPCSERYDSTYKSNGICVGIVLIFCQGLYFLYLIDRSATCDAGTPLYNRNGNSNEQNTILLQSYPNSCEMASGTNAAIVSIILWLITIISIIVIGTPDRTEMNKPATEIQEVTYNRTTNIDGTTTITEQNVMKGTTIPNSTDTDTGTTKLDEVA